MNTFSAISVLTGGCVNFKKLAFFAVASSTSLIFAAEAPPPANQGKAVFEQQCALCHSAAPGDNGGAQGPLLHDIFGREAASTGFSYSQALRSSGLTWDAGTLDRFLAAPSEVVPGSLMVVPIQDDTARANVIAYFQALKEGTFSEPEPRGGGFAGFGGPPPAAPPEGDPDWINDKPGRVHRVDLAALPAPFATGSAVNFPTVVPRPANGELQVPAGFRVEIFATGLQAPRNMVIAPNGDIFITETTSNRISVMRPSPDHSRADSITVYAQGVVQPLGMAFYPATNPQWLYVAEMNRVVRYPYSVGDTIASAVPEVVVPQLAPTGGGHYTRDLTFSPDGTKMYVSVGSQTNVGDGPNDLLPAKSPAEIAAWEASKGLGAAWGNEENRAAVMVFEHGNEAATGRLYATGIRNCVGLTIQPATADLWCSTNERDMLGDDLVPDYSTRVPEGAFFGWPWYYMGNNEDPRHAGKRPDLVGKISVPDVPYTAHSAAVDLAFYPQQPAGNSAFPVEYAGQGFAVLHGSWNRAHRTGHKVVQVPILNGEPTGEYIDFLTGFIDPDGSPWGRPVAIVVASDGSLLLSDDGSNIVYRISYGN
jgi:glucose/arabinose dehydrogenase/cytochrome c2